MRPEERIEAAARVVFEMWLGEGLSRQTAPDLARAVLDASGYPARCAELETQIDKLATFIFENVPGEPSQSEGAVDCAIRLLSGLVARVAELTKVLYAVAISRHNMTHDVPFGDCSVESCVFVRDVLAGVPSAPEEPKNLPMGCVDCARVVTLPEVGPGYVSIEPLQGWTLPPLRCPDCSMRAGVPSAPEGT